MKLADLARRPDFQLGDLRVSPARRRVTGPDHTRVVEPQFMIVFLRLLESAGRVVTRMELFDECWGGAVVGDDSLNRAVAGARQIASAVGSSAFVIETVPRMGYMLKLTAGVEALAATGAEIRPATDLQSAVEDAYDCWRSGFPTPDCEAIDLLDRLLVAERGDARAWGILALLLRKAAEYAPPDECAAFVRRCEQAARRALAQDPGQNDARVALSGIVPIFGNWAKAREQLLAVRQAEADHVPAAHDLAVLEMATGRPSAAFPIIKQLIDRDPLAATFYYKRMYHLWTFGDLPELDLVASGALQLWPRHPAIWLARFWTLVFTRRASQALLFLEDEACRPHMPAAALDLLRGTCSIVAGEGHGKGGRSGSREEVIALALSSSQRGPAQAVAALMSLCALDAIDEAFEVANGYYLGRGEAIAPVRRLPDDPSITDQHRRVTQPLFIPSAQKMREDPRFARLCDDLGLTAYWEQFRLVPDFLAPLADAAHSAAPEGFGAPARQIATGAAVTPLDWFARLLPRRRR